MFSSQQHQMTELYEEYNFIKQTQTHQRLEFIIVSVSIQHYITEHYPMSIKQNITFYIF